MILTAIISVFLTLFGVVVSMIIMFIPHNASGNGVDISSIITLIRNATFIVPADMITLLVSSIVFWYLARLAVAVIAWVVEKIPGINW